MQKLLPRPEVEAALGKRRSAIYADVAAGLLPKPLKFSRRCVRWPSNEIEAIVHARVRGADDAAIKTLVTRLHAARAQAGEG
jgi:prophage regulatory protein